MSRDKKDITERIDNITLVQEEYKRFNPPAPRSVKIELTGSCNYRCGFCALRTREIQPKGTIDWNLFTRIVKEMLENGVEEIGLFYLGEPMMTPGFLIRAIKYCKDIGVPYVFVTSNGSLARKEVVEECMKAGLDSLKWSINAADEEQFERVMEVKAKLFYRALANVKDAWEVRNKGNYNCKLYASSIKFDGEQQEKMEAMLEEHVIPFVDNHYWLPLYSMGSLATKREEELGYRPTAGVQGRLDNLRDPLPCWSAFKEGHVTVDGTLSACCFDADGRFAMGDLNEQSFMEAWNSEKFMELRKAHLKKDVTGTICEECIAYRE